MKVVVVGCGRVGSELAYSLFKSGHKVVIVDLNEEAFRVLPADFRGRTVAGDVLVPDVLLRAGIENADALAAVTPNDAVNVVIAHAVREKYGIKDIVVRDYDPRKRALYEAFNLQVISPSTWGAHRIEEMLLTGALRTVFSAGNGEVEVYELTVPASWAGKQVQEVIKNGQCHPVSVTRAGRAMLPALELILAENDVVHVSATQTGIAGLRDRLQKAQEA